jgi:thiol:disulfide interchange protein DsbC
MVSSPGFSTLALTQGHAMRRLQPILLLMLLLSLPAAADELGDAQVPHLADNAARTIVARLQAVRPELPIRSVVASQLTGFYAIELAGGGMLYATADGRHLFAGDLFEVGDDELVNLAERDRESRRTELLAGVDEEDMLVFAANGDRRAVINVFTDIDCGYCRQLHRDVPRLNELGIEVRYLGYPRAGIGSASYDKLVTAWCSTDQQSAMTRMKLGEELPNQTCENPVADQYALGDRVGVTGTPSIITADGRMIPGYLPPEDLVTRLGLLR